MQGSNPANPRLQNPKSRLRTSNATPVYPPQAAPKATEAQTSKLQAPGSPLQNAAIIGILHKWGIHTLGQLAALNKEDLRERLGSDAVRLWERANGTATRLLKFVQPPETFDESFEFDHEVETAEPLLFILRRFLEQLALRLSSIYLVARELTLTIHFSNSQQVRYEMDSSECQSGLPAAGGAKGDQGSDLPAPSSQLRIASPVYPPQAAPKATRARTSQLRTASVTPVRLGPRTYERVFKIPQPTNDVDLLFRMLQTHLENFKSEHPIVAVALSAQPSRPASQQFGLFETALRNPHQLYETLARLSALVGNDRVGTPVLEETHRPDAFRMEAFDWQVGTSRCDVRGPSEPWPPAAGKPDRQNKHAADTAASTTNPALRRFRPPARTSIFISQHQHLESDKIRGQIMYQSGPFLLSGNWWDEKVWARAEWDMQLESGALVRAHDSDGKWALDGIYD